MKTIVIKINREMSEGKELLSRVLSKYKFSSQINVMRLKSLMGYINYKIDYSVPIIQPEDTELITAQISNYAFSKKYAIPPIQLGILILDQIGIDSLIEMGYVGWIVIMSQPVVNKKNFQNERLVINLTDEGDSLFFVQDCYESGRKWRKQHAFLYIK